MTGIYARRVARIGGPPPPRPVPGRHATSYEPANEYPTGFAPPPGWTPPPIKGGAGLTYAIWVGGYLARVVRPHVTTDRQNPLLATPGATFVDLNDGEAWQSDNWYAVTAASPGDEPLTSAQMGVDGTGPFYDLVGPIAGGEQAVMTVEQGLPTLTV